MSREDIKDQQKDRKDAAQERDLSVSSDLDLSKTEANHQLAQLGSPFAHIPTPSDLTDLWDEADRFFDSLGDPSEFIEPEGNPTYQLSDQDLDYFQNVSQTTPESLTEASSRIDQSSRIPKPKVKFFDQSTSNKKTETLDKVDHQSKKLVKSQKTEMASKTQAAMLPVNKVKAHHTSQTKSKQTQDEANQLDRHEASSKLEKKEN